MSLVPKVVAASGMAALLLAVRLRSRACRVPRTRAIIARNSSGVGRAQESQQETRAKESFARSVPEDWAYIAEGALNLTLKYVGKDAGLRGFVLRVRKDNKEAAGGKSDANPYLKSLRFVDKMIIPLLGTRYVQRGIQVTIKQGYLAQIGQIIEESRPVKRRKHHLDTSLETALLMIDNTMIPQGDGPSICFEIKTKWGFLPSSPFVEIPVKRRVDRFTMHQQEKFATGIETKISRYCPLDLFSPNVEQVRSALDAMIETPQEKFRMFVDGRMVYPDINGHGGRAVFEQVLRQYPQIFDRGGVAGLVNSLAQKFAGEPLFQRLKTVQTFDDCDIEGTWPAYKAILERGETILPLEDGDTLYPRAPPTTHPVKASPEEQHDTVRRFLLSCTAKDCSVMIVMKPCAETLPCHSCRDAKVKLHGPRVVTSSLGYLSSIAIVDLDPKPIAKMKKWFELDQKIAKLYTDLERTGKLA